MYVKLSIENRFITLCEVHSEMDRKGKQQIKNAWKQVERFLEKSSFAGMGNLIITLEVNDEVLFDKTKVKLKKEYYSSVFDVLEEFLMDKIYFYRHLEEEEIDSFLQNQYKQNLKFLKTIRNLKKEMR